jgi:hypothetical protein
LTTLSLNDTNAEDNSELTQHKEKEKKHYSILSFLIVLVRLRRLFNHALFHRLNGSFGAIRWA